MDRTRPQVQDNGSIFYRLLTNGLNPCMIIYRSRREKARSPSGENNSGRRSY